MQTACFFEADVCICSEMTTNTMMYLSVVLTQFHLKVILGVVVLGLFKFLDAKDILIFFPEDPLLKNK